MTKPTSIHWYEQSIFGLTEDCSMGSFDPLQTSRRCSVTGVKQLVENDEVLGNFALPQSHYGLLWVANTHTHGTSSLKTSSCMCIRALLLAQHERTEENTNPPLFLLMEDSFIWLSIQPEKYLDNDMSEWKRLDTVLRAVESIPETYYGEWLKLLDCMLGEFASVSHHSYSDKAGARAWLLVQEQDWKTMETFSVTYHTMSEQG